MKWKMRRWVRWNQMLADQWNEMKSAKVSEMKWKAWKWVKWNESEMKCKKMSADSGKSYFILFFILFCVLFFFLDFLLLIFLLIFFFWFFFQFFSFFIFYLLSVNCTKYPKIDLSADKNAEKSKTPSFSIESFFFWFFFLVFLTFFILTILTTIY